MYVASSGYHSLLLVGQCSLRTLITVDMYVNDKDI